MRILRLAASSALLVGFGCSTPLYPDDASPDSGDGGAPRPDGGKMDGAADAVADSAADGGTDGGGDGAATDGGGDGGGADGGGDGGGADSGGGDAGNFNVGALSGLALWLDAAQGVSKNNQSQVSKWADQSGNGNDAAQATASMQPVYSGSVINGLPALHFDKSKYQAMTIADASSLEWGTGDFLVEVVTRFDNNANNNEYGLLYGKLGQSSGIYLGVNDIVNSTAGLAGGIDGSNWVTTSQSYSDNTARSYAFRRTGSTLELRVNGSQIATASQQGTVDVSASGADVVLGDYSQYAPLDGDVAEIVAVKGSIGSQDLTGLEAYFKAKYNL